MKHIVAQIALIRATVSRLLERAGVSRQSAVSPPPVHGYEYAAPGYPLHIDTNRLGRFVWSRFDRICL